MGVDCIVDLRGHRNSDLGFEFVRATGLRRIAITDLGSRDNLLSDAAACASGFRTRPVTDHAIYWSSQVDYSSGE